MAQPSVACFFNTRKRSALEETKVNRARKVLLLDSSNLTSIVKHGLETENKIILSQNINNDVQVSNDKFSKLQDKEKTRLLPNRIVNNLNVNKKNGARKTVRVARTKKIKEVSNNQDIQQLLISMSKEEDTKGFSMQTNIVQVNEYERHITPPGSPKKMVNAMDKLKQKPDGPSIKEIKKRMSRSSRLAELKTSVNKFQDRMTKLKEIEIKTSLIPESPKLKNFKTIELEVHTSPQKVFSPEKAYLSPKKDSTARRNLIHQLSPTKNAVSVYSSSPSKLTLEVSSKPALTLPYKYRYLAEIFRCIDTVSQILFNRKETITFRKLKPAVEEMLKRNLTEKHISQIKHIYPDAFNFNQERLKVFGSGMKHEKWELVIVPNIGNTEHMNSDILLERRCKLFHILIDKVKNFHDEFLKSLDPPMIIVKDKITRWHPDFDIERVPDIDMATLPQPPLEERFTTGQEVLEKARAMFNCNSRMEQALQKLKESSEPKSTCTDEANPREMPTSASLLKGIPKALLEKVRQRQAAKALVSMTRSVDKEKEVLMYSRLPELVRLTRNLFVSEKKSVLPLDTVVEKLGNCYRVHLTKTEMEEHLKVVSKEVPNWLIFHDIRNCIYLKLAKNVDLSIIINKLESVANQKSEC